VEIIHRLPASTGLIDAISRAISDRGEILDSASDKLGNIRRELRIVHDRLLSRLQRMVNDPKNTPYLQEALITQRDGRYVLPLRAEFKGRIRSIIHDQSSSGATLFVEPLSVVEMNNEYRELQLAERDEERRILADLSLQVGGRAQELSQVVEVVATLDLILARALYSDDMRATAAELYPLEISSLKSETRNPVIRLFQARHPLLDQRTVVPIDFELDPQTFALVITGPNTGGKTVALKTVGLLALMAQSGLHIPAQTGSAMSVFEAVYADIGDEQSIEQSLSTFSGHITNIIHILEKADRRSLVIIDELGAGTDPTEGSALARAILTDLVSRRITTLVTTHHPELKAFAHAAEGVVNASVEFDLETLRPTFHLMIGLPGRSNALAIAQRLGLPEPIITAARREIDPNDLHAEDLLDEIHHQRDLARKAREVAEQARHEAESLRQELMSRLDKIEEERGNVLEEARKQAEQQVDALAQELAAARRSLARLHQPADVLQEVAEKVAELAEAVEAPIEPQQPELGPELRKMEKERRHAIRLGDKVRVRSLGAQGVVISLGPEEAEVSVGVLRLKTNLKDLELPSPSGAVLSTDAPMKLKSKRKSGDPRSDTKSQISGFSLPASPGIELDLRGQRADDAAQALDRYLDAAYLAGLPFVRIIHGKGTGKLRDIVRRALADNRQVKTFEPGAEKEGGEGVTIAKLAVN
jgi:DNA mismatch repair protein MutS2